MQQTEAWPALRGTGVASLHQQPPVSLPSFSFCDLPQDGHGEHAEVCPLWGDTVCRPVCAALHRDAEICRHRSKDENICTTPWGCQHGLLADRGCLRCLRHLYCPGDLGTPEVFGLCEEEVPHWEEEVVSFSGVSWDPSVALTETWPAAGSLNQFCCCFRRHLDDKYYEPSSPELAFVSLICWFSSHLSSHQETCGPCICDPVHITLLCSSHCQFWGMTSSRSLLILITSNISLSLLWLSLLPLMTQCFFYYKRIIFKLWMVIMFYFPK